MDLSQSDLPPHEQAFAWAREAMHQKKWREASGRWAILREAYPTEPMAWSQGAYCEIQCEGWAAAEALLKYSCENFASHAPGFLHSAEFAMRQNQEALAAEILRDARDRFPKTLQTWLRSAEFASKQGDGKQALEWNAFARALAPDNAAGFVQHGEMLMESESWDSAMDAWELVRKRFPHSPSGFQRGMEAAREAGQHKLARQIQLQRQFGDVPAAPEKSYESIAPTPPSTRKYLTLIWVKAVLGLRAEVSRSFLSYGWWILEPLLHMTVYQVVFGLLLNRGGEDFTVFLLTGLIPWMWVAKSISSGSGSILASQNLMLQVGVPPAIFPAVALLKAALKQGPVFLLLFAFVWLMGYPPNPAWWMLLPVILVQALVIAAITGITAAALPFVRDIKHLIPSGIMFLMFLSGVFYDYRTIASEWQPFFLLNPMAFLLKCYREILMQGQAPDAAALAIWGGLGIGTCIILLYLFRSLRYAYPRVILR